MLRKTLTMILFVFVFVFASACSDMTPTNVPQATEAPEAPAIVETAAVEVVSSVHSEKFLVYSPDGKHTAKIVTDNSGETWNLMVDDELRDDNVEETSIVWSPESDALIMVNHGGLCYYRTKNITSNIPQLCYVGQEGPSTPSWVVGFYGEKVWYTSGGKIWSVTPDFGQQPEVFSTAPNGGSSPEGYPDYELNFTGVTATQNGFYIAATTDQGELMIFEADGKFIRMYDCAFADWAYDGVFACVQLNGSESGIMIANITKPGQEVSVNTKSLRPQHLSFSQSGNRLVFYAAGGIFWLGMNELKVFYASDPQGIAVNPSWSGELIVYDDCIETACSGMTVVPDTKWVWEIK